MVSQNLIIFVTVYTLLGTPKQKIHLGCSRWVSIIKPKLLAAAQEESCGTESAESDRGRLRNDGTTSSQVEGLQAFHAAGDRQRISRDGIGEGLGEPGSGGPGQSLNGTVTSEHEGIPNSDLQGHGATRSETGEGCDRARTAGGGRIPATRIGGRGSAERGRSEGTGQGASGSTIPDLSNEFGVRQGLARRVINQSQTAVVEVDRSLTEGRNSQRRGDNETIELIHG